MSKLVERIARARAERDFVALAAYLPYTGWMGISFGEIAGELLGKMVYSDHLVGNPSLPALHGGTMGALLESTAIFQLMWDADTVILPKTITITVDYLRSGRPVDTFAHAHVLKKGRRVTNVHVRAWQEDRERPIATATLHFLIPEAAP